MIPKSWKKFIIKTRSQRSRKPLCNKYQVKINKIIDTATHLITIKKLNKMLSSQIKSQVFNLTRYWPIKTLNRRL